MATITASRKKAPKKPLRIRPELLPDSAKYGTFDGREYVMIPVEDFGEWYEDVEDGAVVEYVVRTESGDVTAVVSDPDAADIAQPGEIVRVDFPTDRGWVLRKADRDEQGEIKAS